MIDGLIGGKLAGKATQRTSQNGKRFVTVRIRTPQDTGDSILVNVIAFDTGVCDALLALDDGDSVSLSGSLSAKVWTDKVGVTHPALDMTAQGIMTSYHVQRKRAAVQKQPSAPQKGNAPQHDMPPWEMDDGAAF